MRQFRSKEGVAEVHAGRFGWPWVRTLAPLQASDTGRNPD
jgi:hypothetical protein